MSISIVHKRIHTEFLGISICVRADNGIYDTAQHRGNHPKKTAPLA